MTLREALAYKHSGLWPVAVFDDRPLHYFIMEYFNMTSAGRDSFDYNYKDCMRMDPNEISIPEKYMDREFCYVNLGSRRVFVSTKKSDVQMYLRWVIAKLQEHKTFDWEPPVQED